MWYSITRTACCVRKQMENLPIRAVSFWEFLKRIYAENSIFKAVYRISCSDMKLFNKSK